VAALVIIAACATPGEGPSITQSADAPYVPTPPEVVTAMLQGVNVGPSDVVYDLGSGDGRIVIAAVREFGARGVGIELDVRLIRESRDTAFNLGVADRATFVWKDIFDVDLSPATVVTIYLFPEVNARLLPKLMRELRPGTRVVSHDYPVGDWKPDRWTQVTSSLRRHTLRFWTVPARR
jgi:cyclopropane fatty-acyl-phospholipid synthase-like methyltransferase